jgi:hypothetical protein
MSRQVVRRLTQAFAPLCFALVAFPQVVLCLGVRGHYAIESVDATCCRSQPLGRAIDAFSELDRCVSRCTDVPLGISAATRDSDRPDVTALSSLLRAAVGLLTGPIPCGHDVRSGQSGPLASPPRHLRTTINLC